LDQSLPHHQNQMKETLLLIDLQDFYLRDMVSGRLKRDHFKELIKSSSSHIKEAMAKDNHIIFLEYSDQARHKTYSLFPSSYPTIQELISETNDYDKRIFCFKKQMSGAFELSQLFKEKKIPHANLKVCGVYTSACVFETVRELLLLYPNIHISIPRDGVADMEELAHPNLLLNLFALDINRVSLFGNHRWSHNVI
jgi:nicotinamidase-related amidase